MKQTLEQLADGSGTPVLVVDFLQFTAARPLGSVLTAPAGRPVFRADPVGDLTRIPGCPGLPALADGYAKLCLDSAALGGRPPLVVGYCSAAALALRVAERLGGPSGAPCHTVLVQPSWPTEARAWEDWESFSAQWSDGARPPLAHPVHQGGEPEAVLEHMMSALEAQTSTAAERRGLGTPEGRALVRDLLDRYRAWLAFQLAVAHDVRTGPVPTTAARLIGGRDDRLGLPWPESRQTGVVRLPVTGEELLEAAELPVTVLTAPAPEGNGEL
ncbi:hypothetical protein ACIRBZ_05430 [Streptomyces sp. NPDC094038]|uniref:hypothetical protein n=1 Tax=Streptomyces sp. NPDC094038 TaxID=3366055 RepID=UPI0038249A9D